MTVNAAYGIYGDDVAIKNVVHSVSQAGFENEDICMMLSPSHPIAATVKVANLFNSGKETNAVSAALIGWLSGLGAVLIPTVGFFIRSQAYFHALMVAQDAPAICENASSLAGLGFSRDLADRLEKQLRQAGALVYVSCSDGAKTDWAREVLRHTGAQEVASLTGRVISGNKIQESMPVQRLLQDAETLPGAFSVAAVVA